MKAKQLQELDAEWIELIAEALDMGLAVQDIQHFLHITSQQSYNSYSS